MEEYKASIIIARTFPKQTNAVTQIIAIIYGVISFISFQKCSAIFHQVLNLKLLSMHHRSLYNI